MLKSNNDYGKFNLLIMILNIIKNNFTTNIINIHNLFLLYLDIFDVLNNFSVPMTMYQNVWNECSIGVYLLYCWSAINFYNFYLFFHSHGTYVIGIVWTFWKTLFNVYTRKAPLISNSNVIKNILVLQYLNNIRIETYRTNKTA